MSFCRWSSNDYHCDLYVYADVQGGYTIHIAGSRYVFNKPLPDKVEFSKENFDAWWAHHKAVQEAVETATLEPIGLKYDGESFYSLEAEEAARLIEELGQLGYQFPKDLAKWILEDEDDIDYNEDI